MQNENGAVVLNRDRRPVLGTNTALVEDAKTVIARQRAATAAKYSAAAEALSGHGAHMGASIIYGLDLFLHLR
jgi:hypothetical protein